MAESAITLIKRFTYRGVNEEWSNQYHFSDAPPTTEAAWKTLVDAVAAKEKTVLHSGIKIVRAYVYTDSDDDSDFTIDYTALGAEITGTLSVTSSEVCPGDAAAWIRWSTGTVGSTGKPVYLRKYYHGALITTTLSDPDGLTSAYKTALSTLGTQLKDGTITGFHLCGPSGQTPGTVAVSQWATTRTLKRRGRRPGA
jgi:hypothetical protein